MEAKIGPWGKLRGFDKCTEVTEGHLVEKTWRHDSEGNRWLEATVIYEVCGKPYKLKKTMERVGTKCTKRIGPVPVWFDDRYAVGGAEEIGDIVQVFYNPKKPNKAYIVTSKGKAK